MSSKKDMPTAVRSYLRDNPNLILIDENGLNQILTNKARVIEAQCFMPDMGVREQAKDFITMYPQFNDISLFERVENMIRANSVSDSEMMRCYREYCGLKKQLKPAA